MYSGILVNPVYVYNPSGNVQPKIVDPMSEIATTENNTSLVGNAQQLASQKENKSEEQSTRNDKLGTGILTYQQKSANMLLQFLN